MFILLDDSSCKDLLFPFGQVRSVAHIRIGICTIFEKWNFYFPGNVYVASERSIRGLTEDQCIQYPANFIPSNEFLKQIAFQKTKIAFMPGCKLLEHPWQIFENNDWAIREDFEMITKGRHSEKISASSHTVNPENIFIEDGAKIHFSILNAEAGPVYIGKNAEIQEGSMLRGPVAVGEGTRIKMGTRIYGATTLGPYCLAGGEIKNSVITGFSNKAHDGYLGDSVLGEWCNLGAGTSNSNLKNNVSSVKVWNKRENQFNAAGEKCGLLMGDYSRSAINTSFNTGTVVGVCCNVFGNPFPPKFIDNFSWGNEKYHLEKALEDIQNWKKLKNSEITGEEIQSLKNLYD